MALPSTFAQQDPFQRASGVMLNLVPTDISLRLQVQRTSELSTGGAASTAAVDLVELPPVPEAGQTYLDSLPLDGARRFYRSRHTGDGVDASTWTEWTTGHKPVSLGQQELLTGVSSLSVYPVKRDRKMDDGYYAIAASNTTGSEFRADIYLPSTYVINVGTTGTPATITKRIRIPASEFLVASSTYVYLQSAGSIQSGTLAATSTQLLSLTAPALVPLGITLTEISAALYATSTAVTASVTVSRLDSTNPDNGSALASLSWSTNGGSTTGWQFPTASLSQVATSSGYFHFGGSIQNPSATAEGRIGYLEFTYTMPSYDRGY